MKFKQVVFLMIACLLIGCSSSEKEKTIVCEDNSPYSIYKAQVMTLTALSGEVSELEREVVIEFESQEARDDMVSILENTYQALSSINGLSMKHEIIDDTSLKDIRVFDLEVMSLGILVDLGILKEASNNLETITNQIEIAGLTCREER